MLSHAIAWTKLEHSVLSEIGTKRQMRRDPTRPRLRVARRGGRGARAGAGGRERQEGVFNGQGCPFGKVRRFWR